MNYKNITFKELQNLLGNNTIVIDVRTAEEWEENNLTNSVNLPLTEISLDKIISVCEKFSKDGVISKDKPINLVFYCRSGARSVRAIESLLEDVDLDNNILTLQNYTLIIYNLKGGINSLSLYM